MLLSLEPVKIFHQFIYLCFKQFKNIPLGKLVGIIFNCFVDFLGLNAVQFGHIGVQNHLLIPIRFSQNVAVTRTVWLNVNI